MMAFSFLKHPALNGEFCLVASVHADVFFDSAGERRSGWLNEPTVKGRRRPSRH